MGNKQGKIESDYFVDASMDLTSPSDDEDVLGKSNLSGCIQGLAPFGKIENSLFIGEMAAEAQCIPFVRSCLVTQHPLDNDHEGNQTRVLTIPYTEDEEEMEDGHLPTKESDLFRLRDYVIVTTAALPWMTGTAVNPLLRAAYLSRYQRSLLPEDEQGRSTVTLVIPWLESAHDREDLYGPSWLECTQEEQEAYIRDWLATQAQMPMEAKVETGGIKILFYPARYHPGLSSIFAMGDLSQMIFEDHDEANGTRDNPPDTVCILEEPEHFHFYSAQNWRKHFCHVVGVIHTNYKAYASSPSNSCFSPILGSLITGPLVGAVSSLLVRAYCDQVIKLSSVLQPFASEKEIVCNVHGIRQAFLEEGARRAQDGGSENKVYFLGKLLWAKGLDKLLELQSVYRNTCGDYFPMDIYGSGPEQEEIEHVYTTDRSRLFSDKALSSTSGEPSKLLTYFSFIRQKPPVPARFLGRKDHAQLTGEYKIFVNPSITEVLCTSTAEATAMGKFVIIPVHPSNTFFAQFPNSLMYRTKTEFVSLLQYALENEPEPLSTELRHVLTWEAATERFLDSAAISRKDARRRDRLGKTESAERIAKMHHAISRGPKGDVIRKVLGGGPVSQQFQYEQDMRCY